MMARIPATKSPYPAGIAQALGNELETTPGTKKLKPIKRRNMCGATSQISAWLLLMARSDGHTNSAAATMELIRLIKTLNPKAARGFIAHLFDAALPNVRSQDEPHNARFFVALRNVCFCHKADISQLSSNVRFWG
jgi:hypothetical protein